MVAGVGSPERAWGCRDDGPVEPLLAAKTRDTGDTPLHLACARGVVCRAFHQSIRAGLHTRLYCGIGRGREDGEAAPGPRCRPSH